MALEIERRFLVDARKLPKKLPAGDDLVQGFLGVGCFLGRLAADSYFDRNRRGGVGQGHHDEHQKAEKEIKLERRNVARSTARKVVDAEKPRLGQEHD